MKKKEEDLSPHSRAEDILLGSLGFGEEASILTIEKTNHGYRGVGVWPDGEKFQFENDDELDDLQRWALKVIAR
ncbi:MAG: hypothetical protein ACK5GN_11930 [Pseudomonadota bacterium]|jgi:hypothetical protein